MPSDSAATTATATDRQVVLAKRLLVDTAAAAAASFGVSGFITIVDRAIIENANGARKLGDGLKQLSYDFVRHPLKFIGRKEFRIVFGLYTATYVSANATDTVCAHVEVDNQAPKFVATTAVNMTLCIAKDRAFTRMFGVIAPAAFPMASIGLFALRDSLTIAASFNAPQAISKQLQEKAEFKEKNASMLAQLLCPAVVQFVSTPVHLLGLDLYNNKGAIFKDRMLFLQREYWKSAFARIGRIAPAFGIGGIGNTYFRNSWRAKLQVE